MRPTEQAAKPSAGLAEESQESEVSDFCRENMLDYYEMVEALKQEKLEVESYEEQVQCGDLVITEIPESNDPTRPKPSTEGYIKEVMLSFPKGLRLTVREITPSDLITIVPSNLFAYTFRCKSV